MDSKELEALNTAALEHARKASVAPDKETPDWIITDFKAGWKAHEEQMKQRIEELERKAEAWDDLKSSIEAQIHVGSSVEYILQISAERLGIELP